MASHCCTSTQNSASNLPGRYRQVLWAALLINGALFAVEICAGILAGSASLLADSLDFLGDTTNYAISLSVLGMSLAVRAKASLVKALSMALFALVVLGGALWRIVAGGVPDAPTMGVVGTLALTANLVVAALLYVYREGDSNMRSVWLCTRNDALGNLAVLLAALGVFGTGSAWPDLAVATFMAMLALSAAWQISVQAHLELVEGKSSQAPTH